MRRDRDPESGRRGSRLRRRHHRPRPPIERPTPERRLRYWLRLEKPEYDGAIEFNIVTDDLLIDHTSGRIVIRRANWLARQHQTVVYSAPFPRGQDREAALEAHRVLSQIDGRRVKITFMYACATEA